MQRVKCSLTEVGDRQKRRRIAEDVRNELLSCLEASDNGRSDNHAANEPSERGNEVLLCDPTARHPQSPGALSLPCASITGERNASDFSSSDTELGASTSPHAEHMCASSSGGDATSPPRPESSLQTNLRAWAVSTKVPASHLLS